MAWDSVMLDYPIAKCLMKALKCIAIVGLLSVINTIKSVGSNPIATRQLQ